MSIVNTIQQDIKMCMKGGEANILTALRGIMAEAQQLALKDKRKELIDDDVISTLIKLLKEGHECIDIYTNIDTESAKSNLEKAKIQVAVCTKYMPIQLTIDEVKLSITNCICTTGATSIKEMGKVMGAFTALVQKGTYDPKQVSQLIKEALA